MKKQTKFRLIPFLISLFIVVGATTGIVLYSYYNWQDNKVAFLNGYFHEDDHADISTSTLIDNAAKWSNDYYQQNPGTLTYRTPKGELIGNTASTKTDNMYIDENGVLKGTKFSLTMFGVANYGDDETWAMQYQFFMSDIYYKNKDFSPEKYYFLFVKGTGKATEATVNPETGKVLPKAAIKDYLLAHPNVTLTGDNALNYLYAAIQTTDGDLGAGGGTTPSVYKYSYQNTQTSATTNCYIYDNNAQDAEKAVENHYAYQYTMKKNSTNEYNFNDCTEGLTFAIYYEDNASDEDGGDTEITKVVEGTFNGVEKVEGFKANGKCYKGYSLDFYKAPMGRYIWKRLLLHGAIAFVISGVLDVLFYFIWQDDEEVSSSNKKKKQVTSKK